MRSIVFIISLVILLLSTMISGCTATDSNKIKVVTSTSLLAYIAQQVGSDQVVVTNLIPPAQHPGNFNIRPGDIEILAKAKLFLIHGWPGEGYVEKLVASANNPDLTVFKASVTGNWMTPPVQAEATGKVSTALIEVDKLNTNIYISNAGKYKARIAAKEAEIKKKLSNANVTQVSVITANMQAEFLKWAGLNIVATYADPNALNPQIIKDLVDKGRKGNVTLVVDNLQNGKDGGKGIAEELGVIQLNLSNFPGGFEKTDTWEKAIDRNVSLILEAISK